ncbi:MAG: segregation ATPase FtsK/SpoIIIE, family [Actinomycetia bacterium]|nr:segregation ATPase FtsK/SpoIIIE, family [Actinomycetes bacterium]
MDDRSPCEGCGFVFAEVSPADLGDGLRVAAAAFVDLLTGTARAALVRRAEPDVWSPLEYACHARDVVLNLRDRVLLAQVEDGPVFPPMYRHHRLVLARYIEEDARVVADGIRVGADLLAWVVAGLDADQLARPGTYGGVERDALWIARHALHEARHHALDAQRGIALPSTFR